MNVSVLHLVFEPAPLFETTAQSLKIAPIIAPVHSAVEIETTIIGLGHEPRGGLVVMPDLFVQVHRAPIISAAARNNVPAVYYLSPLPETAACSRTDPTR